MTSSDAPCVSSAGSGGEPGRRSRPFPFPLLPAITPWWFSGVPSSPAAGARRRALSAPVRLDVDSVTIDGEAVCLLEDGRPDFHTLRSRPTCRDARLVAFDLLALNGQDLRRMPLHSRRKRLAALLSGWREAL